MFNPESTWWPHPDKQLESLFVRGETTQLLAGLRHPRVAADPYARLRILDRLHRMNPDDEPIRAAWIQAMLLGNRPHVVWPETKTWPTTTTTATDLGLLLLAAQVAQALGETDEARQRYSDLLQEFPSSVDVWQKYIEFEEPERLPADTSSQLERLRSSTNSRYEREKIGFSLARYWQFRHPGSAFLFACEAHKLKRLRAGKFDSFAKAKRLNADRQWKPQTFAPGSPPTPIFVVGLPRSGTTLLSSILAGHDKISNAGEQTLIPSLAAGPCRSAGAPDIRLSEFIQAWYRAAVGDLARDAIAVVDKLPANAESCGLILAMFPNALIVHIERNLADCAISIHMHDFELGCSYADDVTDLVDYTNMVSNHLRHWHSQAPDRIFRIRFEDLVTNPESVLEPLLTTLKLAWDPAMLDFWKRKDKIATYSERQVRRPLNRSGIDRWRKFLPEAMPFFNALGVST
ncbi:MAG TPA: sulfotransferase [Pseudoxanthomonas sp.]|nr:sulfotransferase [Pseudoxanthomonas sp.]